MTHGEDEFEFDVGTVIHVQADSEEEARQKIKEQIDELQTLDCFVIDAEILERKG